MMPRRSRGTPRQHTTIERGACVEIAWPQNQIADHRDRCGRLHHRDALPARIPRLSQVERDDRRAGRALAAAAPKRSAWIYWPATSPPTSAPALERRSARRRRRRGQPRRPRLLEHPATHRRSACTRGDGTIVARSEARQIGWTATLAPRGASAACAAHWAASSRSATIGDHCRPSRTARLRAGTARTTRTRRAARFHVAGCGSSRVAGALITRRARAGRVDAGAAPRAADRRTDPLGRTHRRRRLHAAAQGHQRR